MVLSAQKAYEREMVPRARFLERARRNARLTIPSVMSEPVTGQIVHIVEPYQNVGAEAVVNLSSRLLIALLPPGRNFFRLALSETLIAAVGEDPRLTEELNEWSRQLAAYEAAAQSVVDASNWRVMTDAALQQLLVAGNYLEYIDPETTSIKIYRIDQFCVKRDYLGNMTEVIILEKMSKESLPENAQGLVTTSDKDKTDIELYTWMRLERGRWKVHQEINEKIVPKSEGYILAEEFPYRHVRYKVIPGEVYGRSKVDEHAADLRQLELLEKSIAEGAQMAARHLFLVKPSASGLRKKIAEANNGDILVGFPEDVTAITFDNHAGLQVAAARSENLERRIRYAFLLHRAAQRDAERVTATEINAIIEELETALGGVYSMLAHDLMGWRLERLLFNLRRKGVIPGLLPEDVEPRVLTGLEALNRDRDVARVRTAAELIQMFGPEAMEVIDVGALLRQALIGLGLHDVTLTAQEVEEKRQQAAALQAAQEGVAGAIPQMVQGGQ